LAYEDCHHSLDGNVLEAGNKLTIGERIALRKRDYQFIFAALRCTFAAPQQVTDLIGVFCRNGLSHNLILGKSIVISDDYYFLLSIWKMYILRQ